MSHIKAASKHDQVSVEEGIRRFGNKAVEAVLSEYSQLTTNRYSGLDLRMNSPQNRNRRHSI